MGRIERKQISVLKEDYICDVFVKESALLRSIRLSAPSVAAHMQLSPIEGSVLSFFIKMQNPSKILEIGTFVGYSAACMASVMSVSAFLTCVEKNNEYYKIAKQNLAHFSNVGIVNDDAKKTLQGIQGEFDLVFLDADKSSYCIYLDYIELFLRKGGLLISDNTLLFGKVFDRSSTNIASLVMREFNKRISDSDKYETFFVPTADGMCISVKKF